MHTLLVSGVFPDSDLACFGSFAAAVCECLGHRRRVRGQVDPAPEHLGQGRRDAGFSPEQKHARKPRPLKAGQTRGMLPESSHSGSGFARADEKARFRFPGSSACCSVAGPHAFQVPLASPLRLAPRKVGLHGSVLHPRKKTSHNQEIRRGHPEDFCLRAGSSPRSSGQELYCLARHAQDSEDQSGRHPWWPGTTARDEFLPRYLQHVRDNLLDQLPELFGKILVVDSITTFPSEGDALAGLVFEALSEQARAPRAVRTRKSAKRLVNRLGVPSRRRWGLRWRPWSMRPRSFPSTCALLRCESSSRNIG